MFSFVVLLMLCYRVIDVHAGNMKEHYEKLPPEAKPVVDELHRTCMQQTGANENDLADMNIGKFNDEKSMKKYVVCQWKTLGILDDDNQFDSDALIDLMPPHSLEFTKKFVSACKSKFGAPTTEDEVADGAYNILKCAYDVDPAAFFFF